MEEANDQLNQKKSLKKVRRHFLQRRVDNEEQFPTNVSPDFFKNNANDDDNDDQIANNQLSQLSDIETHILPPMSRIESIRVEGDSQSMIVTLTFGTEADTVLVPWKEKPKDCEIIGDVNLTTWSAGVEEYFKMYPRIIDKYFDLLHSNNPEIYANMRKAKAKAIKTCKSIESAYPFRKLTLFLSKETTKILSFSYSEKFLEEIDYTLQTFVSSIKTNGFPRLFENEFPVCPKTMNFLDSLIESGEFFQQEQDFSTVCLCRDGSRREFKAQYMCVIEPVSEGLFSCVYIVLKQRLCLDEQQKDKNAFLQIGDGNNNFGDMQNKIE